MAIGRPIVQNIDPEFGLIGKTITVIGCNFDDNLTIEFLNGPEVVTPILVSNSSPSQFIFQTPDIAFGRYDLKVTNSFGQSLGSVRFEVIENAMDPIKVCPDKLNENGYACTQAEYQPKGDSFTRKVDTFFHTLFKAVGASMERVDDSICEMINETTPQLTKNFISEWEKELGLPEECVEAPPTSEDLRRKEVVRKFNSLGGGTKAYFIELAASMGVKITIEESEGEPFRAGQSQAGDPLMGGPWLFTWFVRIEEVTIQTFKAGQNKAGDPLRWWANEELECFFKKLKPAHTIVAFRYGPEEVALVWSWNENEIVGWNENEIVGIGPKELLIAWSWNENETVGWNENETVGIAKR